MATKTVKDMAMEKMFRQIGDEVVEYTAEEYAQYEIDKAEDVKQAAAKAVNATNKGAAEAKLAALGLTADDLKALGL
jgi:hypothetical protein